MNNSPDVFFLIRVHCANVKAQQSALQLMEFKAHDNTIDEYHYEMLHHLYNLQAKSLPNLLLIQQQPDINLKMRPLLLDFLMDVINKLNLSKSTFPLCVNLIDRYCSTRIVKKQHYQLLGLTSLWISCKNSDSKAKIPSLNDLCKMCCNCYDKKLFLEMENHLLKSLNWLISFPTFDSFIDIISERYASSELFIDSHFTIKQVKYLALYICELIQFYPNIYFNYKSIEIAASSFIISLLILNFKINHVTEIFNLNETFKLEIINPKKFQNLYSQLGKVLKCPPPSLKLKYYHKANKYLYLMQMLIKFCNIHAASLSLNPITPKNSIYKLNHFPPTPLSSNNISPIENPHLKEFLPSPRLSPHNTYFQGSPPVTPFDFTHPVKTVSASNSNSNNNSASASISTSTTATTTASAVANSSCIPALLSDNGSSDSLTCSASSTSLTKKRSFHLSQIHLDPSDDSLSDDENMKRSKLQKPIFYFN